MFIILLSSAGLLWPHHWILTAVYAGVSIYLLATRWSSGTVAYYCVAFVLGPTAEYYAVLQGAWTYTSGPFTLPVWLPFGWGIAGVIVRSVGDSVTVLLGGWVDSGSALRGGETTPEG